MKTTLSYLALATVLIGSATLGHADPVKSEEAFDKAAGLFNRDWKPPTNQTTQQPKSTQFPTPTPPQVQPGLPPWSQQPQGSQTPTAPIFIIAPPV